MQKPDVMFKHFAYFRRALKRPEVREHTIMSPNVRAEAGNLRQQSRTMQAPFDPTAGCGKHTLFPHRPNNEE